MKRFLLIAVVAVACLGVLAAPALASAQTFTVHPNGGNDTADIQAAFNKAVKAGPGSTVQLSAGHFYTNRILVHNFRGTFKGAGEGSNGTVIDCPRGLDPSRPGVIVKAEPDVLAFPYLVCFDGGNVGVSDMSFDITALSPVDPEANGGSDALVTIVFVTGNASSAFARVGFTSGAGSDAGYNADQDLIFVGYTPRDANGNAVRFPALRGSESVRGCSFVGGHDGLVEEGLTHGSLTVSRNVFDTAILNCGLLDNSASQITVCDNQMQCSGWANVVLVQGWEAGGAGDASLLPPMPAPQYLISGNHILCTGGDCGVQVQDQSCLYSAPFRLKAAIADNTITLDNAGWDGGIDGIWGQGILVTHNRISGTGLAGIDVGAVAALFGATPGPCSGWQIIGNDVSGVTATADQFGVPTAQVWLGSEASNCLVVGGCAPTKVLDQGTKDILINVTKLDPPAAAATPMNSMKQTKSPKEMRRF
jgi:hypothetical protein